jgi:hypothetical protein
MHVDDLVECDDVFSNRRRDVMYGWFGDNLSLLYEKIAPKLQEEFDRVVTIQVTD